VAEALKAHYGPEVPRRIAAMIRAVHPKFDVRAFMRDVLDAYAALELMPRGHRIAEALRAHLPRDYPRALDILLASIHQPATLPGKNPMATFLFLPHTLFVAKYGLAHFGLSMRAQHALTQRITAEISIRKFIEQNQILTLNTLKAWARDPSEHVRRLVSEGTRPRLPWAPRLRAFMRDPRPVLELLEWLKDDPSRYVRRSVANNLNDIGKDHPDLLFATAERWMKDANENRQWIIRHADQRHRHGAGELRAAGALSEH
jgi:3-methyladenine DNA glycosylase AlkC